MAQKTVTQKPIAVYTRVSEQGSRSDEELLSHDIQRDKVGSYLNALDLPASKERFEDNSRSGRKMSRPANVTYSSSRAAL
jgi:DNA invertase Pin-like site-specific DNA recombinase